MVEQSEQISVLLWLCVWDFFVLVQQIVCLLLWALISVFCCSFSEIYTEGLNWLLHQWLCWLKHIHTHQYTQNNPFNGGCHSNPHQHLRVYAPFFLFYIWCLCPGHSLKRTFSHIQNQILIRTQITYEALNSPHSLPFHLNTWPFIPAPLFP